MAAAPLGTGPLGEDALEAAEAASQARPPGPVTRVRALRLGVEHPGEREEHLATEEPLEIRVGDRRIAVTMRTPGADFELAVGWLFAEGIVRGTADVRGIRYCTDVELTPEERFNVVTVDLEPSAAAAAAATAATRSFVVTSACGVCGRDTLDDLHARGHLRSPVTAPLDPELLASLPDRLRSSQKVFERTGGLHAAGLFTGAGEAVVVREDVGRHNAVDKVVGRALLDGLLPLRDHVLVVSGRTSYELAQKAVAAGVSALVSVSAPSSLAVSVAREFGLTLCGFVRDGRLTVYAGAEQVAGASTLTGRADRPR